MATSTARQRRWGLMPSGSCSSRSPTSRPASSRLPALHIGARWALASPRRQQGSRVGQQKHKWSGHVVVVAPLGRLAVRKLQLVVPVLCPAAQSVALPAVIRIKPGCYSRISASCAWYCTYVHTSAPRPSPGNMAPCRRCASSCKALPATWPASARPRCSMTHRWVLAALLRPARAQALPRRAFRSSPAVAPPLGRQQRHGHGSTWRCQVPRRCTCWAGAPAARPARFPVASPEPTASSSCWLSWRLPCHVRCGSCASSV